MAIATATLAAIGAGLSAGGKLGGAIMQNKAANRASAAQQQAQNQALAYERERQAIEDQRYNDRWNDYLARHKAWEQRNFGGGGATQTFTSRPAASGPAVDPSALMETAAQSARTAGGMASTQRPEGQTLADWSDWRNYIGANQ